MTDNKLGAILFFIALLATGCGGSYQVRPLPPAPPDWPRYAAGFDGVSLSARAIVEPEENRYLFGYDFFKEGVLPVLVIVDNQSDRLLEVNGPRTWLEDKMGRQYPILHSKTAYRVATKNLRAIEVATTTSAGTLIGAVGGTAVGALAGAIYHENLKTTTENGFWIGLITGGAVGFLSGITDDNAHEAVARDLRKKMLQDRRVDPKGVVQGVLFFPCEASDAGTLRLVISDPASGEAHATLIDLDRVPNPNIPDRKPAGSRSYAADYPGADRLQSPMVSGLL